MERYDLLTATSLLAWPGPASPSLSGIRCPAAERRGRR